MEEDEELDPSLCGNLTLEYFQVWKSYEYWCEGVVFSILGLLGLVSNMLVIITIISSTSMRKHTFNQLLATLSAYDIL